MLMTGELQRRMVVLPVAMALMALAAGHSSSAQQPFLAPPQPAVARLPADALDVLPPSARTRGAPGQMTVQWLPCRAASIADARRRIVDIAVQEWGFFGFGVAAPADTDDDARSGDVGNAADGPLDGGSRRRRPRLPPAEAARVASSIAGYWAVTPEGPWIVGRQNERWNSEDGAAARWNAPWSAAFVSWVMCEAGLGSAGQFKRAVAHYSYIDQAIRARDGAAPQAAFVAYDAGEAAVEPGDLLCSSRRPVYSTIAHRRRQLDVGSRSHCDVVVQVDTARGRLFAIGGNVRGVVSLKPLPLEHRAGTLPRPGTGDDERPMFAHLKLRAPSVEPHAMDVSPTISALGCGARSGVASVIAQRLAAAGVSRRTC